MVRHPLTVASSLPPPVQYEPTPEAKRTLPKHWRLFAGVFLAVVVSVTVGTLLVPKHYTATVKMMVGSVQPAADAGHSNALSYDTIVDLVHEGTVVKKVIDTLKLDETSAQLRGYVGVKSLWNTPIVGLSATSRTPEQAAAIANTFAAVLIDRDRELAGARAVAAQSSLQTAISKAQNTLQQANSALSAYQARNDTESKLEDLKDDQEQTQAKLSSALAQMAALTPTIPGQQITDVNPATTSLRQQLAETETQLASARSRYTDQNPTLKALAQQRDVLSRQLARQPVTVAGQTIAIPNPVYQQLSQQAATLRSHIQEDVVGIAELQRRRAALAPAIAALPAQTTQLEVLQERANSASDVYKALEQKYDDAVVAANSAISDVTVVQPAESDNVTVSPNLLFNVIASAVIGFVAGLIAVAIANYRRRKIRKDGNNELLLGLPEISGIGSLAKQERPALPWFHPNQLMRRKSGAHVIVITSPEKGDGKTAIPYDVASAMSQVLSRVLLIDTDMRGSPTHEILSGRRSFDQVVVRYTATLDVLTLGASLPNTGVLDESAALDDLLDLTRERYDCVIVDRRALVPANGSGAPAESEGRGAADGTDFATLSETLKTISTRLDRLTAQVGGLSAGSDDAEIG